MKKKACLRTFAWLSHDRPDALRRSIRSFLNQVGPVAPTYQFIIAESGPFQSKPDFLPGKDVIYIDDSYREKLIAYLEDGLRTLGVKKDIVRFALDAHQPEGSEGVHRNAIALLTRGELFVCTDDDVLFDLRTLPASAKRQTEAGTSDFLPFKDFSELESFEAGAASVSVQEFIARQEEALQSTTFCSPGIRGDSAYGGPRFIFTFDDSSLQTFCRDQDFVSKALGSRVMWRQTAKSHIVSYASLATYMLGMNGSKGLAPCFPFGRNVDGAFVYATKALHPSAQTAQLSVSVSHRPLFDRGSYSSLRELEMRINDVIWLLWSEWLQLTPNVADVGARYRLASAHFQSLADQSLSDFRDFLIELVGRTLRDRANKLEAQVGRLIAQPVEPGLAAWIQIAEDEVRLCRKIAQEKTLLLPVESWIRSGTDFERLSLAQKWIGSYGDLLESWPLMQSLVAREEYTHDLYHSSISN